MPNSFQPIFCQSTLVCFCAQSSLSSSSPALSYGLPPHSVHLLVQFASSCSSLSPSSSSPTSLVLLERSLSCSQTVRFLNIMGVSSYVVFISLPPTTRSLPRPPRLLSCSVLFATGSSSPVHPLLVRPLLVRPPPVRPLPVLPLPVHPPPVRLPVQFTFLSSLPHRPVTF